MSYVQARVTVSVSCTDISGWGWVTVCATLDSVGKRRERPQWGKTPERESRWTHSWYLCPPTYPLLDPNPRRNVSAFWLPIAGLCEVIQFLCYFIFSCSKAPFDNIVNKDLHFPYQNGWRSGVSTVRQQASYWQLPHRVRSLLLWSGLSLFSLTLLLQSRKWYDGEWVGRSGELCLSKESVFSQ